jgi:PAS domain S-box-containing protein
MAMLYVSKTIVLRGFARLEEQEAQTNIERAKNSVDVELTDLVRICKDWAPWDDSQNFVLGKNPEYIASNLLADSLSNFNLNFMMFIDLSGKIFHITAVDPEKGEFVQLPETVVDGILANKSLLTMTEPKDSKSDIIILPDEIIMVAAQPISNSLSEKPISGTLIMGRYLNDRMIKILSERTQLDISISRNDAPAYDHDASVVVLSKDSIAGFVNISNLNGDKHITLKTIMPRAIYNRGLTTVRYFTTAIISGVVSILAILLFVMHKIILRPINTLTKNFMDIRNNHDTSTKLYTERNDEIGTLARSFDEMMENLKNKMADLDESQNLTRNIIDTDPAIIFVKDCDGRYLLVNKAMAGLFDTTCKDMLGKTNMDFLGSAISSSEQIDKFAGDDRKVILSQKPLFVKEEQFASPKGWSKWLQIYKIPITIKGNPKCVLGIGVDITERKKNQDETNSLNRELITATEKVETANIELRNFVYVASHDLREPLNKIAMLSNVLHRSLTDKLTGNDAENLNLMIEGANRMTKMVEGLLDYSRVDMETHPFKTVDANEIIEQLKESELSVLLDGKNAIIEIPQSLPTVIADPVQFRQLLGNLIANGILYQDKDSTPHITITSKPAADGMTKIEVADNGIGIKPEYHQTVFMVFKRVASGDEYEGTGIGLAVCKKIIERHGGKIGLKSTPGKGSTFWFTIPTSSAAVFAAHV